MIHSNKKTSSNSSNDKNEDDETTSEVSTENTTNEIKLNITLDNISKRLNKITLYERPDIEALNKLIKSDLLLTTFNSKMSNVLYQNEKQQLIAYRNLIDKNGLVPVTYGKTKGFIYGRVFPSRSLGAVGIRREIRGTLFQKNMVDIDIENCHPVLSYQICEANGIKNKYLEKYVLNRPELLEHLQTIYNVDRDTAKNLFIMLLYFGTFETWAKNNNVVEKENKFISKFKNELSIIGDIIIKNNLELKKEVEKLKAKQSKNIGDNDIKRSTVSIYFQEIENAILEEVYFYCIENKYINKCCSLCYDGLMIERESYKPELLNELNKLIKNKFGFDLKFTEKEMKYYDNLDEHLVEEDDVKGVWNDLEAAETVYKLYPNWVYCMRELYVFDMTTGMWSSDENIHFKIISSYNDHLYLLSEGKHGEIKQTKKGYGNSTVLQRQMIPQIKTLCSNNDWLKNKQNSSLGKLLFMNGYLDMKTNIFYNEFNPDVVFMCRIQQDYKPELLDNVYINDIERRLFIDPLGKDVGDFYMLSLSRAIAGDMVKRLLFGLGSTNGGKSTATKACLNAFGEYVGNFNAENLAYRNSSSDEGAKLRWVLLMRFKRLIFSNEIKTNTELNGNDIKKLSSGGDSLIGRIHGGLECEFIPHFMTVIFANDIPLITPYDDAVDNRVKIIGFNKQFVEDPTNEYELKRDDKLEDEMKTDKFKQHFIALIINRYIKFNNEENRKEIIPEAVNNSKTEWIGDISEFSIIGKFCNEFSLTNNETDHVLSSDIISWLELQKAGISIKKFSVELTKYCNIKKFNNITSKTKKICGRCAKVWTGIKKIVEEFDDEDDDDM